MKKIIIAILSTMLMIQSIVPVVAEGTFITEFSEEEVISEIEEIEEDQTITSFEELESEKQTDAQITPIVENEETEMSETEIISEVKKNEDLISGREYLSKIAYGGQPYRVEYSKLAPTVPSMHPIEYTVSDYQVLKNYLQSTQSPDKIKLTSDINFPTDKDVNALITIPPGAGKELDLNGYTINAGNRGQIEVQGDYFKIMNGTIIGGYGNNSNVVPSEDVRSSTYKRGGFIFAPSKLNKKGPFLENDIVFENITHRNTDISETGSGGFIAVNTSNLFFKGNNTLTNGNYNIKGGSVTFMDGKFVGRVTRQTNKSLGFDSYGRDGTINIGFFGYGTDNYRNVSNQFNGDKRVTVLEDAEVELYNLNKKGHKWYNNCIGNFAVITVDGSLKMYSTYPPLRSILSETHNEGKIEEGYTDSKARTYNGLANININEGATFIAEAQESDGTHGTIFTYNTTLNIYQPAEVDIDDMSRNTDHPFFHSGNKNFRSPGSSLSIYDTDMAVWPKNRTNNDNEAIIWTDVIRFENSGFYSFLNGLGGPSKGRIDAAEPNNIGLGNFNILNYGRLRSEGDGPLIVPNEKFKVDNNYTLGNGDDEFYGKAYYRKKDEWGRVIPIRNGVVQLKSINMPQTIFETTTDNNGNWHFDFSSLDRYSRARVGENQLTVVEPIENKKSRIVKVSVKDTIAPVGETQLIMFKKGDTDRLIRPIEDGALLSAEDETTPSGSLMITYYNLGANRDRIINTPGSHTVIVEIKDIAGNYIRIPTPVFVYEDEKPNGAFIEGNDFTIDKNIFEEAMNSSDKSLMRELLKQDEYGKVKAVELDDQGNQTVITDDVNKFFIQVGSLQTGTLNGNQVKYYPIDLTVIINGQEKVTKRIKANVVENSIKVTVHQVIKRDSWPSSGAELPKTTDIFKDLENRVEIGESVFLIEKPVDSNVSFILIQDALENWEKQNRLQLERNGYNRVVNKDDNGKIKYHHYFQFASNPYYIYSENAMFPTFDTHIYVEYMPQIMFSEVPDFDYGEIKLTSESEKTHALDTPKAGSGSLIESNVATIVNTLEKEEWSLNLAVKDNKILKKENGQLTNEVFLGNLVYYKNGQEIDISGTPTTLYTYQKGAGDVDLIYDIDFYSANEKEGMRLKEHIGNAIGDYEGQLVWTLTSAPIP